MYEFDQCHIQHTKKIFIIFDNEIKETFCYLSVSGLNRMFANKGKLWKPRNSNTLTLLIQTAQFITNVMMLVRCTKCLTKYFFLIDR